MEMHQLFTRQSLSRHRCQYLFTWWRKSCQSFQICLFASFTSRCYGLFYVPWGLVAFFSLGWLWGIAGTSFQVWFCHWRSLWAEKGMGRAQQNPSGGSGAAITVPPALPGAPAIPCPTPLDIATTLEYSVTSLLVPTSFWNLLYF